MPILKLDHCYIIKRLLKIQVTPAQYSKRLPFSSTHLRKNCSKYPISAMKSLYGMFRACYSNACKYRSMDLCTLTFASVFTTRSFQLL